jgi:hypothetical protein
MRANDSLTNAEWLRDIRAKLLKSIALLKEQEDEIQRHELFLMREGYRRCDIAACNCGWWHQHEGFKRRFDEIEEATNYWWRNGETLLDRIKRIAKIARKAGPI